MYRSNTNRLLSSQTLPNYTLRQKILAIAMVTIGICTNLMFISLSIKWGCEMNKCGLWIGEWHYHDALWHIAVARVSFTSFPFLFPAAFGYQLTSYNYLLGLILHIFELVKICAFIAYFYILPVAANALFLHALTRYMRQTEKTPHQVLWILFFSYLASSFSYFLILYTGDFQSFSVLKGFPVVTTLQPSIVLSNIQFYLSLSLFFYLATDVIQGVTSYKTIILQLVILVVCVGLKIYTGLLAIAVLTVGYLYWAYIRKSFKYFTHLGVLAAGAIGAYYLFYLPGNSYVRGIPFALYPLSIPHTLTESHNLFYHERFTLGRYYLLGLGKFSLRLILYETISALLFVVFNLGTRLVFVFTFLLGKYTLEKVLLLSVTCIGLLIPIFYIQDSGGWYNSIQFAYVSIYTSGILAALVMARVSTMRVKTSAVLVSLFVVLLSLPNTFLTYRFLTKEKILISDSQLKALAFLKSQPHGVTLSMPDGKSSSYVPAFTEKISYLVDDEQGDLLKLPLAERKKARDSRDCQVLSNVQYLYFYSTEGREFLTCAGMQNFQKIYDADGILIYASLLPRPKL